MPALLSLRLRRRKTVARMGMVEVHGSQVPPWASASVWTLLGLESDLSFYSELATAQRSWTGLPWLLDVPQFHRHHSWATFCPGPWSRRGEAVHGSWGSPRVEGGRDTKNTADYWAIVDASWIFPGHLIGGWK